MEEIFEGRQHRTRAGTRRHTKTRANFPDLRNWNSNHVLQLTGKRFSGAICEVGNQERLLKHAKKIR